MGERTCVFFCMGYPKACVYFTCTMVKLVRSISLPQQSPHRNPSFVLLKCATLGLVYFIQTRVSQISVCRDKQKHLLDLYVCHTQSRTRQQAEVILTSIKSRFCSKRTSRLFIHSLTHKHTHTMQPAYSSDTSAFHLHLVGVSYTVAYFLEYNFCFIFLLVYTCFYQSQLSYFWLLFYYCCLYYSVSSFVSRVGYSCPLLKKHLLSATPSAVGFNRYLIKYTFNRG